MFDTKEINSLIQRRRSIFPNMYNGEKIPKEIIEQILANANWAPTHRLTEPWRFKIFESEESRQKLSTYLGQQYELKTPKGKFSPMKHKKTKKKPLQSSCVIAICMQRDEKESVPEWEEVAAVACAVQNMWLTCTAYGIGSYWSSPQIILDANDFLELKKGESCLGLFYMGYYDAATKVESPRNPIEDKIEWK